MFFSMTTLEGFFIMSVKDGFGLVANTADEFKSPKPSLTDMMKKPSKVVMLKNMVGPGEVDEELEPEVKEECEGKYGEIVKVKIKELEPEVKEECEGKYG